MTGQIADTVIFRGEEFQIIGISAGELFDPFDHGMCPEMLHTACWRGFFASYRIDGDSISLDQLTIREHDGRYPALNGILPEAGSYKEGAAVYRHVGLFLPFCGKLRIAREFITALYIHMGFQKPSAFRTVLDLTFTDGILMDILDRSEEAARIRGRFKVKDRDMPMESIQDFIRESFSQDMEELK